jgi:aspartate racemase
MARVGLVGGLGPESTVDYYERIIALWQRHEPGSAPLIVVDSLDVQQAIRLVTGDRPALIAYLAESVRRLAAAGADFVAMTANTPHLVFDEVASRSPVPLLSIVETCAAAAARLGLRRLALLGTRFTMEASFYPEVCARYGITVVPPDEEDRAWIHARYLGELLKGEFTRSTRDEFTTLVGRLRDQKGVDGVVLGGTELPLLLRDETIAGVPALDTTALHVEAIVGRLRDGEGPG